MIPTLPLFILQSSGNSGSGIGCCIVPLIVFGFIAWAIHDSNQKKLRALREAESAYREALEHLKMYPQDADIKENALRLGRYYSGLTRGMSGKNNVTLYDEVAIMNDINAACAAASAPQYSASYRQPASSVEERLSNLADLRSRGVINESEYEMRRQRILNEL